MFMVVVAIDKIAVVPLDRSNVQEISIGKSCLRV
jgi:hypothetical protein